MTERLTAVVQEDVLGFQIPAEEEPRCVIHVRLNVEITHHNITILRTFGSMTTWSVLCYALIV